MKSIFTNKSQIPTDSELKIALGKTYFYWQELVNYTFKSYPGAIEEWKFTSEKYGWSYTIRDNKRVLIYLLPRDKFFKVAFVFGQKATDKILESTIAESIKQELKAAKVYAEGRGIRLVVNNETNLDDIMELINIKLTK